MSIEQCIHFRGSPLEVKYASVHSSKRFGTIAIGEANDRPPSGYPSTTTLFFSRVSDIETLVDALQKLGNELAAAQQPEAEPSFVREDRNGKLHFDDAADAMHSQQSKEVSQ